MKEHGIQNAIRVALVDDAFCFRANVGTGWQGTGKPFRATSRITVSMNPGDVLLHGARPFDTGLPAGFHDLFGWVETPITPDMVGQSFARFFSIEVKSETGSMRKGQADFRAAVVRSGGVSGVARNPAEAVALVRGAKSGQLWH